MARRSKRTMVWAVVFTTGLAACGGRTTPPPEQSEPVSVPGTPSPAAATAPQVVDAFEHNFGVHPGLRRNHAKGVCATGQFVGDAAARTWSRSALFSGEPVPVVARFSLPGGNPAAPDAGSAPRGMALEFRLADGSLQHMTLLNVPVFSAATPQSFYEGLLASEPDPATGKPDPERLRAYRESHPDTAPLARFMQTYQPPASYASARYFGIHAFVAVDSEGNRTPVKWHFEPEDGEQTLEPSQMADMPVDFLEDTLAARADKGPIRWRMWLTAGEPDDPTDDPTRAWPDDRRSVSAGILTLDTVAGRVDVPCEPVNFDPMVMADGLDPGDDPILAFRSGAYAVSFARRLSEVRKTATHDQ